MKCRDCRGLALWKARTERWVLLFVFYGNVEGRGETEG